MERYHYCSIFCFYLYARVVGNVDEVSDLSDFVEFHFFDVCAVFMFCRSEKDPSDKGCLAVFLKGHLRHAAFFDIYRLSGDLLDIFHRAYVGKAYKGFGIAPLCK